MDKKILDSEFNSLPNYWWNLTSVSNFSIMINDFNEE
jgi:hypothetical protein